MSRFHARTILALSAFWFSTGPASAQVERIWLTHRTNDPSKLVVNWTTKMPGESQVRFGPSKDYGQEVHVPGNTTLHHVEIPVAKKDAEVNGTAGLSDRWRRAPRTPARIRAK